MKGKDFVLRLMKYRRVLNQLRSLGLERVFSNNLGDAIDASAAVVRRDLMSIEIQGNKRGGYRIDEILERVVALLDKGHEQEVILVGCGNLGRALLSNTSFRDEGIHFVAGFDTAQKGPKIAGVPILPIEELEDFVAEHGIHVALIAVPAAAAAGLRDLLTQAGIRGILNFTPVELKSSDRCITNNVNIGLEIENLFYQVNSMRRR